MYLRIISVYKLFAQNKLIIFSVKFYLSFFIEISFKLLLKYKIIFPMIYINGIIYCKIIYFLS